MPTRALLPLLLAFPAAALLNAQDASRPAQFTDADREAGAKTFRSHCSPCHGMNAEGGRGPNLAQGVFYRGSSDQALLHNISNGIEGTEMPGLFYSPDRVWQVVAYLRSLTPREKAPGDPARGATLFTQKGCSGCHRIEGQGGRMGPDLTHIGTTRALKHLREALTTPDADVRQRYWLVTASGPGGKPVSGFLLNEDTYSVQLIDESGNLASIDKAGLRNYQVTKKSKMPSFASLPPSEVDDLVAYLASLRRPGGSRP